MLWMNDVEEIAFGNKVFLSDMQSITDNSERLKPKFQDSFKQPRFIQYNFSSGSNNNNNNKNKNKNKNKYNNKGYYYIDSNTIGSQIFLRDIKDLCKVQDTNLVPAFFILGDSMYPEVFDIIFQTFSQFPDFMAPPLDQSKRYWSNFIGDNYQQTQKKAEKFHLLSYLKAQFETNHNNNHNKQQKNGSRIWRLDGSSIVSVHPHLLNTILTNLIPCNTKFLLVIENPIYAWQSLSFQSSASASAPSSFPSIKKLENVEKYLQQQFDIKDSFDHFGIESGRNQFVYDLQRAYLWSLYQEKNENKKKYHLQNYQISEDQELLFLQHCYYTRIAIILYQLRKNLQTVVKYNIYDIYDDMIIRLAHMFKIVQLESLMKNFQSYIVLIMCWVKFDIWEWEQCYSLFSYFDTFPSPYYPQSNHNHSNIHKNGGKEKKNKEEEEEDEEKEKKKLMEKKNSEKWDMVGIEWIHTTMDVKSLSSVLRYQEKMPFFDTYWNFIHNFTSPFESALIRNISNTNFNSKFNQTSQMYHYCNKALYDLLEFKSELVLGQFEKWS